jgi:hypothetical protein
MNGGITVGFANYGKKFYGAIRMIEYFQIEIPSSS